MNLKAFLDILWVGDYKANNNVGTVVVLLNGIWVSLLAIFASSINVLQHIIIKFPYNPCSGYRSEFEILCFRNLATENTTCCFV